MKKTTVHLILQDLRHNQLLHSLEEGGGDMDMYYLDIMTVVWQLITQSASTVSDLFAATYHSFMVEAPAYDVTGRGDTLIPLAEDCYRLLHACCEIERRTESK